MMQKMMRKFYTTDENAKDIRNDFFAIGQKVNSHVVPIKYLEQQLKIYPQLSATPTCHTSEQHYQKSKK